MFGNKSQGALDFSVQSFAKIGNKRYTWILSCSTGWPLSAWLSLFSKIKPRRRWRSRRLGRPSKASSHNSSQSSSSVAAILAIIDTTTISRFLGSGSGFLGILGASLVGAITLIPGFVAFPAAASLLNGGAGATQIAAFVSSLMMVGVVTLPMEMKYFGKQAALLRNGLAWVFSIAAAFFVGWAVSV